jgi:hypothetical protein
LPLPYLQLYLVAVKNNSLSNREVQKSAKMRVPSAGPVFRANVSRD